MTDVLQQDVLQRSVVRSIRATRGEWEKWGLAAKEHGVALNAWVRLVLNDSSSYTLETKPDARESRNQLLDVVRGRGPVSKYFDRR